MIDASQKIFVATKTIDFRGSFDRLAGFVREQLGDDPRSGALFVFMNKAGNRLKIFFFDQTGDCILYKRLDRGTFRGVVDFEGEIRRIKVDAAAFKNLLAGLAEKDKHKIH